MKPTDAPSLEAFITAQLRARYRRKARAFERKLIARMPYGIMPSSIVIAGPLQPEELRPGGLAIEKENRHQRRKRHRIQR